MSVARAQADMALRRCLRGEVLEREALLELLAVPPASDEALYLRHAAHKAALALDGGRAYLWGALGLDYTPCPMNCAFCSLGEAWKLIDAPRSYTETEIIAHARAYVAAGARFVVLRTTQFYDLDALCGMLAAIRKAVPGGYEIILNTGEFDADAALAVRRAGGSGVYHTIRVREGRDTRDPREATSAGGGPAFGCSGGAVGPEHADQELADCLRTATGASISGVMARVPVPGTPLGDQPPLSPARLAQLAAIFRLAGGGRLAGVCAHPAALENMTAGANIVVVEKGAIPRDSAPSEQDWQTFSAAGAVRLLRRAGYAVRDGDGREIEDNLCMRNGETSMTATEAENHVQIVRPEHCGARVIVLVQPEERRLSLPRPKTARQLLEALGLAEETALVARQGELLTPDRGIWPDDELLVRKVASSG
ncbi:MAG: hypothetical protein ACLU98_12410 [Desulfovibrio fairfieldensis]